MLNDPAKHLLHYNNPAKILFFGNEQEGPHQGRQTLFIKNDVPSEVIKQHMTYKPTVEQFYFGAGALSEVNWATVKEMLYYRQATVETCTEFDLNIFEWTRCPTVFFTIEQFGETTNYDKAFFHKLLELKTDCLYIKVCTGEYVHFLKPSNFSNRFDGYPDDRILWSDT